MTFIEIKAWSELMAPWAAIGVTVFVAYRVQIVHKLVNSEMDKFRATLNRLANANEEAAFSAGQQNVRDSIRGITAAAAGATIAAAGATVAAAEATKAAVTLVVTERPATVKEGPA